MMLLCLYAGLICYADKLRRVREIQMIPSAGIRLYESFSFLSSGNFFHVHTSYRVKAEDSE